MSTVEVPSNMYEPYRWADQKQTESQGDSAATAVPHRPLGQSSPTTYGSGTPQIMDTTVAIRASRIWVIPSTCEFVVDVTDVGWCRVAAVTFR